MYRLFLYSTTAVDKNAYGILCANKLLNNLHANEYKEGFKVIKDFCVDDIIAALKNEFSRCAIDGEILVEEMRLEFGGELKRCIVVKADYDNIAYVLPVVYCRQS